LNPPAQPVSPLLDHTDAPACQRCGACCFSPSETYVRLDGADWARLGPDAERVAHFIGNRAYLRIAGGGCMALAVSPDPETGARRFFCTVYDRRPRGRIRAFSLKP
jgi:hypothetical protein